MLTAFTKFINKKGKIELILSCIKSGYLKSLNGELDEIEVKVWKNEKNKNEVDVYVNYIKFGDELNATDSLDNQLVTPIELKDIIKLEKALYNTYFLHIKYDNSRENGQIFRYIIKPTITRAQKPTIRYQ